MKDVHLIIQGLFATALLCGGAVSVTAKPVVVNILGNDKESEVTYKAQAHPGGMTWEGKGSGIVGQFKIKDATVIEGQASFPVERLNSEMSLRDKHMIEFMKTTQYPDAKFVPTKLPWSDPSVVLKEATNKLPFEGKMSFRGKENPVTGTVSSSPRQSGQVLYTFNFKVALNNYLYETNDKDKDKDKKDVLPHKLGITLDSDVEVTVTALGKVDAQ